MTSEKMKWSKYQNKIESYCKQKQGIIDDLEMCIRYTPNRENDLLCFMEQYVKAETKNRPRILKQIKCCIDEEEYENPFLAYNCYDERDIKEFGNILDDFIYSLKDSNGIFEEIERIIENTVQRINELHDKCCGQLIDSWRNERLMEYLVTSAEYAGYQNTKNIIKAKKLW